MDRERDNFLMDLENELLESFDEGSVLPRGRQRLYDNEWVEHVREGIEGHSDVTWEQYVAWVRGDGGDEWFQEEAQVVDEDVVREWCWRAERVAGVAADIKDELECDLLGARSHARALQVLCREQRRADELADLARKAADELRRLTARVEDAAATRAELRRVTLSLCPTMTVACSHLLLERSTSTSARRRLQAGRHRASQALAPSRSRTSRWWHALIRHRPASSGVRGSDWYYFAETSSPVVAGDVFTLSYDGSDCVAFRLAVGTVSFAYHMYGATMGTLSLVSGHCVQTSVECE
jgi:hypothetical protein